MKNKNKILIMILSTVFTVILSISFTYAFFYYGKEGSTITLESGSISLKLEEDANFLTLHDTYPKSDNVGMISTNYYDFTVSGSKGKYDDILYEIQIEQMEDNTLAEEYVKVYLTDQEDNELGSRAKSLIDLPISEYNKNRVVYNGYIYNEDQEENYRLRAWVDEKYTKNFQETFNFKLVLYAINTEEVKALYETVEESLVSYLTEPDGEEDYDARFIKGNKNDASLKNYVWYSGKLWRIVALNNNGTLKIVTQNNITTLAWGENDVYEDSYIYEWLNTVFLDTLYSYKKFIVTDYLWNATRDNWQNKPINTVMVKGIVGTLNSYEFVKTNPSVSSGYLNNEYQWWTLSPSSREGYIMSVKKSGGIDSTIYKPTSSFGIRPSVNLLRNVLICSGDGSKDNPYTLCGDLKIGNNKQLLNERISGEYIKFNNMLYRIVKIKNIDGKMLSKITMIDYSNGKKGIIGDSKFGNLNFSAIAGVGLYLRDYFNSDTVDNNYKKMIASIDDGVVWYQGPNDGINNDYKKILLGNKVISTFGLPYYGELFSAQFGTSSYSSTYIFLMTKYDASKVWYIDQNGIGYSSSTSSNVWGVRPSFFLKSDVRIGDVDGDGDFGDGTINHPYEIYMD